jgi:hypothetical protein
MQADQMQVDQLKQPPKVRDAQHWELNSYGKACETSVGWLPPMPLDR